MAGKQPGTVPVLARYVAGQAYHHILAPAAAKLRSAVSAGAIANAIGVFVPGLAQRYFVNRQRLASYTGASRTGANKTWRPKNQSADAILYRDREFLMARARDLERNSPHVSGALNKICNNVIYTGIFPQARLRTPSGLQKDLNDRAETLFKAWAESLLVRWYEKQELILRRLVVDGEVLLHRHVDQTLLKQGLCPLGLEVLEADYLDRSIDGLQANGNMARAGIEFDPAGHPVAYHLHPDHPGDYAFSTSFHTRSSDLTGQTRRIPASEIRHIFHPLRPSQSRGVTWLASIIIEMRDFVEYQSSERIAARLASAFGLFVKSPYAEHQISHPLVDPETGRPTVTIDDIPRYIEPGRIDVLPPGMEITSAQHNRPGQTYEPYTKVSLKSASAGTPLSYENFSNDYAESSYAAARQAMLEERRGYRKIQHLLVRQACQWVWDSFVLYLSLASMNPAGALTAIPVQHQLPGWPWIDPAKDARGAETELKLKITTRRRLAAERGLDWDEEIEELAEEEAILKEKGLQDAAATQPTPTRSPYASL